MGVGLAICGSGFGACLMAASFDSAVDAFTWRGLLILMGAVFAQLAVSSLSPLFLSNVVLLFFFFTPSA